MIIDRRSLVGTFIEVYGSDFVVCIFSSVLDMFGLVHLAGLQSVNPTWWYLGAAHLIILSTPFYVIINSKLSCRESRGAFLILLWVIVLRFFADDSLNSQYMKCMLSSFTGVFMRQEYAPERIHAFFYRRKMNLLELLLLLFALGVVITIGQHGGLSRYYTACLMMPILFQLSKDFLGKIPGVSSVLAQLGKASGIMFMTHTFVYLLLDRSRTYTYHYPYAIQSYFFIVTITWALAVLIRRVMAITGYNTWLQKEFIR